ncbi:hypothetical protein [Marinomonas sp.]|uniref:hypothetical protein n=1 Tax=Marinomonas sp. TaxID=1904862 RepID=UPI003A8FDA7C
MTVSLDTIMQDARAAIITLTEEAKQTRAELAELDRTITECRLPFLPAGDDMKKLPPHEREWIMQAYAQHAKDQARQSGMSKRLDFIEREISHWQERITIAQRR